MGNGKATKKSSLADPTRLNPFKKKNGLLQVVIETPRSSHNKYAFDREQGIFCMSKVLPAGMSFPYDFGFLPGTIAGDGDPIDVLVLMDEPAYPGCMLIARLIGVIKGEQIEGKERIRNDRILAVAEASHIYANVMGLDDLPKPFLKELEEFFVNYHRLEGKKYKLLGCDGAAAALGLIKKAREAA